jgi:hypothetical protein
MVALWKNSTILPPLPGVATKVPVPAPQIVTVAEIGNKAVSLESTLKRVQALGQPTMLLDLIQTKVESLFRRLTGKL